jgi:hypothetical protein
MFCKQTMIGLRGEFQTVVKRASTHYPRRTTRHGLACGDANWARQCEGRHR